MPKTYTKKQHEEYLNNFYSENYSFEQIEEQLGYLSSKRGLAIAYNNNNLGSLLRKKDPIAFNCSYNDSKEQINR